MQLIGEEDLKIHTEFDQKLVIVEVRKHSLISSDLKPGSTIYRLCDLEKDNWNHSFCHPPSSIMSVKCVRCVGRVGGER